jgi:phage gp29-like protein
MAEPLKAASVQALLKKETVPWWSGLASAQTGVAIVDNPDPVLLYMAQRNEEIYRVMERSELAIKTARQKRDNTLLAARSEVQAGSNQSPAAKTLKDWTVAFLKRIPDFPMVQRQILDAIYWGWRPLEVLWEAEFSHEGSQYLGVKSIREKKPEQFKFTKERDLAWYNPELPTPTGDPELFRLELPANRMRWLVATHGSTDNPYGVGLYQAVWFLWYIKNRFVEMWSKGMGRSLGVVVARQSAGSMADASQDPVVAMESIKTELRDVLDLLNKNNILIERGNWTLDFVSDVSFSSGWQQALDALDKKLMLAVATDLLSFDEAQHGSRAQATVHRTTAIDTARMDARFLESVINDQLLDVALEANHGEIDPEDKPRWRSKIHNRLTMEGAQALFDMGAPLDGSRLAEEWGVPLATDPSDDTYVIQKVEQLQFPFGPEPGGGPSSSQGGNQSPPGPRRPQAPRPTRRAQQQSPEREERRQARA